MTEVDGISKALLEFADSIDADGDDLRPLLRRAAEALTDRSAQVRSAVSGAAKFADRAFALERILRRVIEEFNDAARQVGYAVPRANAISQVEAARNELAAYFTMTEAAKAEAFKAGMLRAAEIAEDRGEQYAQPVQHHYDMRQGCYDAAAAIRAEAKGSGG